MAYPRTDEDIKHDVVESLYWDTRVDASDMGVLVHDGHVTLVGSVRTYRSRQAAREDAMLIRGVRAVDNRLEVEVSPELDSPTDRELRDTVTEVLAADPDLGARDIEVAVAAGKVRLRGTVGTYWEKELATALVSTVPAVRGVVGELAVVPVGNHDDEAVARDVLAALGRNRHVDVSQIDVEVEDGRVTLSGGVPDEHVRRQVLDAARYAGGVTGVRDELVTPG